MGAFFQPRLVEALAGLPGFVTFIPARFTLPLHDSDYKYLPFTAPYVELDEKAKELGVSLTYVWTGMFDNGAFLYG